MNKRILKIALPAIATNITIPLLSLVDLAIAGHLGDKSFICAISVGGTLINMLYWTFGFLRMSTSGLTAQAFGAQDSPAIANILPRSIVISLLACLLIFLLKTPIQHLSFNYMGLTPDVAQSAAYYFSICILGAPAVMTLYSIKGWLIGMQNSLYPMIIAISINVINIICSFLFVYGFNWGLTGIVLGTLFSQYCGLLLALLLWKHKYSGLIPLIDKKQIFNANKFKHFTKINGGIAIRTLCLTAVTTFFTLAGAKQGTTLLAVNTLLIQLFSIFSYFTDGFAYAGEALCGRYLGAKDFTNLNKTIRYLFIWGWSLVLVFTIAYIFFTQEFLHILTNDNTIIEASAEYHIWVIAIPICGFSAFLWDGIMVGTTMVKGMVTAMICATLLFFSLYNILIDTIQNNGLWIAFLCYLSTRGIVQAIYFKLKMAANRLDD